MHGVRREQRMCRELAEARRHIRYLEERLDVAEVDAQATDAQLETVVSALKLLATKVCELAPPEFLEGPVMATMFHTLADYQEPIERIETLMPRTGRY